MKTEKRRQRLGWLAACLLAVVPAANAADDIAADWRELLATGNYADIAQTYELVTFVRDEAGKIDAARCREKAAAIEAAVKVNRVGLGLWLAAQDCARAVGDEALAEQRQQRFEALLAHALQRRSVLQGQVPIPVLAVLDAEAVALATGQKVLFHSYEPYEGGRYLTLTLGLWDENSRRETLLEFDYLDATVQLQRDQPGAEFPSFRRKWVNTTLKVAAEQAPESELAMLQALHDLMSSDKEDVLLAAFRHIIARAQDGDMTASVLLALVCTKALDCRDQAMDALLPLAEKRYSMALITLAYLQARETKKAANRKAMLALLSQADQRLGTVDGSLMFAALSMELGDAKTALLVEKTLEQAAAAGNLRAGVVLPALRGRTLQEYNDKDLSYLAAAAEAGMPMAQFNYALHLFVQKKMEPGEQWMRRAAEAGFPNAQKWLGTAYYYGKRGLKRDVEAGLRWLKLAGHGGQGDASAVVGQHYVETGGSLAAYQRAEAWLQSGVAQESRSASLFLAELYERDIEGLGGNAANAAKIFEQLAAEPDGAAARRGLARLLGWGQGVEQDVPRAEKLLRPDAQNGQVESQVQLGELLLQRNRSDAEMAEGVKWLRLAAASGVIGAKARLAEALWWGRGTPAEPKVARGLWDEVMAKITLPMVNNNFAWAHCTPKDPALLDAAAGLAAIQKVAGREDASAFNIGTLAACQAASGDFSAAVTNQKRCIAKLEAAEKPDQKILQDARADLERYQAGKRNDLGSY